MINKRKASTSTQNQAINAIKFYFEKVPGREKDLGFDKNIIFASGGKGKKDRTTILAHHSIKVLTRYLKKYSRSSMANILKTAGRKAEIKKNITPHVIRHSFAIHLLENGTDIRMIQELPGHASPKTSMIYTNVSTTSLAKIKSSMDELVSLQKEDPGD